MGLEPQRAQLGTPCCVHRTSGLSGWEGAGLSSLRETVDFVTRAPSGDFLPAVSMLCPPRLWLLAL